MWTWLRMDVEKVSLMGKSPGLLTLLAVKTRAFIYPKCLLGLLTDLVYQTFLSTNAHKN